MTIHYLKTDPYAWDLVASGQKTYELRLNDRGFSAGATLILDRTEYTSMEMRAGAPLIYSTRGVECTVSHVLNGPVYGLQSGWCILSIQLVRLHVLPHWEKYKSAWFSGRDFTERMLTAARIECWKEYFKELEGEQK